MRMLRHYMKQSHMAMNLAVIVLINEITVITAKALADR